MRSWFVSVTGLRVTCSSNTRYPRFKLPFSCRVSRRRPKRLFQMATKSCSTRRIIILIVRGVLTGSVTTAMLPPPLARPHEPLPEAAKELLEDFIHKTRYELFDDFVHVAW